MLFKIILAYMIMKIKPIAFLWASFTSYMKFSNVFFILFIIYMKNSFSQSTCWFLCNCVIWNRIFSGFITIFCHYFFLVRLNVLRQFFFYFRCVFPSELCLI